MGQRASDTRGVTFEDVVVPKEVRCDFYHYAEEGTWLIKANNTDLKGSKERAALPKRKCNLTPNSSFSFSKLEILCQ